MMYVMLIKCWFGRMGWFNRGKEEEPPAQTTPGTSVMFERKDVE